MIFICYINNFKKPNYIHTVINRESCFVIVVSQEPDWVVDGPVPRLHVLVCHGHDARCIVSMQIHEFLGDSVNLKLIQFLKHEI